MWHTLLFENFLLNNSFLSWSKQCIRYWLWVKGDDVDAPRVKLTPSPVPPWESDVATISHTPTHMSPSLLSLFHSAHSFRRSNLSESVYWHGFSICENEIHVLRSFTPPLHIRSHHHHLRIHPHLRSWTFQRTRQFLPPRWRQRRHRHFPTLFRPRWWPFLHPVTSLSLSLSLSLDSSCESVRLVVKLFTLLHFYWMLDLKCKIRGLLMPDLGGFVNSYELGGKIWTQWFKKWDGEKLHQLIAFFL